MRYKVRIEGRTFEAEVGNVDARPIVVVVEGERFEVWPERLAAGGAVPGAEEGGPAAEARPAATEPAARLREAAPGPGPRAPAPRAAAPATAPPRGAATAQVRAPIPGVVDSVAVRSGDRVAAGDPLCVIEAMKMKNIIRANRSGTIADVLVAPGRHVKHNDVLVQFADLGGAGL